MAKTGGWSIEEARGVRGLPGDASRSVLPQHRVVHELHGCHWMLLHHCRTASTFQRSLSPRLLLEETILQTVLFVLLNTPSVITKSSTYTKLPQLHVVKLLLINTAERNFPQKCMPQISLLCEFVIRENKRIAIAVYKQKTQLISCQIKLRKTKTSWNNPNMQLTQCVT